MLSPGWSCTCTLATFRMKYYSFVDDWADTRQTDNIAVLEAFTLAAIKTPDMACSFSFRITGQGAVTREVTVVA